MHKKPNSISCVLLEIMESVPDNQNQYRKYWYEFKDPALVWSLLSDAVQSSLNSTAAGDFDNWAEC